MNNINFIENNSQQNLNKKSNLVMSIIALAVFVVFIFGASYAYYTSSVTLTNGVININLNMPAKAPGCTITCNKTEIVFNTSKITTAKMLNTTATLLDTQSISCNVTYAAGGTGTKCIFDATWNWVSTGANIYNTTANAQYTGWNYSSTGPTSTCNKSSTNVPGTNTKIITGCALAGADTETTGTFTFTTTFTKTATVQDVMASKVFRAQLKISGATIAPA